MAEDNYVTLTDDVLLNAPFPKAMLYGKREIEVRKGGVKFTLTIPKYAVSTAAQFWAAVKVELGLADGDVVKVDVRLSNLDHLPEQGYIGVVVGMPLDVGLWAAICDPRAVELEALPVVPETDFVPRDAEGSIDLGTMLKMMKMAQARGGGGDE